MQVELIRFRKQISTLFTLTFRIEEFNAISLTEPNSRELQLPDSVYFHSTEYNRNNADILTPDRCDVGQSMGALSLVTQLRY